MSPTMPELSRDRVILGPNCLVTKEIRVSEFWLSGEENCSECRDNGGIIYNSEVNY